MNFEDFDKALSKIKGFEAGSILEHNTYSEVSEWINSGNYLLNAQLSGSMFGGYPNNRITGLAGDPGTGKTFLCLNAVREAQKIGYNIIYCETESSVDRTTAAKFGINTAKVRYQPVTTISEFRTFCRTVVDMVKETRKKNPTFKVLIVLDSLGMLGTDKEHADALAGKNAADMGLKAKEIRTLFRVITNPLADVGVPLLITNHTYTGGGYIPTKEWSGGLGAVYSASSILMLSKAQLKEGDTKTGIIVTSKPYKNRFARPLPIKFHLSFYTGMNPYVGLEDFISWEACGIQRGSILTEKEFNKLKDGEEKKKIEPTRFVHVDEDSGEEQILYFVGKETSRTFAVKHLGGTIYPKDLFKANIFTLDVLKQLDENKIKAHFTLPNLDELKDQEGSELEDELFNEGGE